MTAGPGPGGTGGDGRNEIGDIARNGARIGDGVGGVGAGVEIGEIAIGAAGVGTGLGGIGAGAGGYGAAGACGTEIGAGAEIREPTLLRVAASRNMKSRTSG